MLAALIIVFREVFEAGLIVGIVLAATQAVAHRSRWVSGGVAAGVFGACLVAVFAGALSAAFAGAGQELFNAAVLSVAVVMLTWHNVWIVASRARAGRRDPRGRKVGGDGADDARGACGRGRGWRCCARARRSCLFLYGILASGGTSGMSVLLGGLFGLALGRSFAGSPMSGCCAFRRATCSP